MQFVQEATQLSWYSHPQTLDQPFPIAGQRPLGGGIGQPNWAGVRVRDLSFWLKAMWWLCTAHASSRLPAPYFSSCAQSLSQAQKYILSSGLESKCMSITEYSLKPWMTSWTILLSSGDNCTQLQSHKLVESGGFFTLDQQHSQCWCEVVKRSFPQEYGMTEVVCLHVIASTSCLALLRIFSIPITAWTALSAPPWSWAWEYSYENSLSLQFLFIFLWFRKYSVCSMSWFTLIWIQELFSQHLGTIQWHLQI